MASYLALRPRSDDWQRRRPPRLTVRHVGATGRTSRRRGARPSAASWRRRSRRHPLDLARRLPAEPAGSDRPAPFELAAQSPPSAWARSRARRGCHEVVPGLHARRRVRRRRGSTADDRRSAPACGPAGREAQTGGRHISPAAGWDRPASAPGHAQGKPQESISTAMSGFSRCARATVSRTRATIAIGTRPSKKPSTSLRLVEGLRRPRAPSVHRRPATNRTAGRQAAASAPCQLSAQSVAGSFAGDQHDAEGALTPLSHPPRLRYAKTNRPRSSARWMTATVHDQRAPVSRHAGSRMGAAMTVATPIVGISTRAPGSAWGPWPDATGASGVPRRASQFGAAREHGVGSFLASTARQGPARPRALTDISRRWREPPPAHGHVGLVAFVRRHAAQGPSPAQTRADSCAPSMMKPCVRTRAA